MYNLVCHLPDTIENHIVCEETENLEQFELPNIHALKDINGWDYFWYKRLKKLKIARRHPKLLVEVSRQNSVPILHSHFGHIGWQDVEAARRAELKHVVSFYGWDVNSLPQQKPYWRARYAELFAHVNQVLCEGPYMAERIVDLGCPSDKIDVYHLGIAIDKIAFKPRKWSPSEPLRVLIAASFKEKKGIPYALEALGSLQHRLPIEVTIVGDANYEKKSQLEKQKILSVIDNHGLSSKVKMLGYQPYQNIFKEAYRHHVFISPSVTASDGDTEGGAPVSLIEMAATGMPIVSTQHCDIPEVIHHNVTGLLAEERDVSGLVSHLEWLVNHPEKWQDMTMAGRKRVEAEYDARLQGEKLAAIYLNL
ncbi:MAG: glycosyltransferase [Elainellaceae cyanobacterium]